MRILRQIAVRLAAFAVGCSVRAAAAVLCAMLSGPLTYRDVSIGCGFRNWTQENECSDGTQGSISGWEDYSDDGRLLPPGLEPRLLTGTSQTQQEYYRETPGTIRIRVRAASELWRSIAIGGSAEFAYSV